MIQTQRNKSCHLTSLYSDSDEEMGDSDSDEVSNGLITIFPCIGIFNSSFSQYISSNFRRGLHIFARIPY